MRLSQANSRAQQYNSKCTQTGPNSETLLNPCRKSKARGWGGGGEVLSYYTNDVQSMLLALTRTFDRFTRNPPFEMDHHHRRSKSPSPPQWDHCQSHRQTLCLRDVIEPVLSLIFPHILHENIFCKKKTIIHLTPFSYRTSFLSCGHHLS